MAHGTSNTLASPITFILDLSASERPKMPRTVLAIAVGETQTALLITTNPPPSGVRPYIQGLITGLSNKNYTIGNTGSYVIDYRTCPGSQLDTLIASLSTPSAFFCMSTRVVESAYKKYHNNTSVPIIGVVSDHSPYDKGANPNSNVCGFSAKRTGKPTDFYNNFLLAFPGRSAIYAIHDRDYKPSKSLFDAINALLPHGSQLQALDAREGQDFLTPLGSVPGTAGVLVLPIDRCFGLADDIIRSSPAPTFWTAPDWVSSAPNVGAYGVSQQLCGQRMANKLAYIWDNSGQMPDPRFADAQDGDFSWIASSAGPAQRGGAAPPAGLTAIAVTAGQGGQKRRP
jgi:hypothetical protein